MDKLLEVQSLKKYYGKVDSQTKALDGISFQVFEGEFIGIMGSSGSGKTTLLNCIASAAKPTEGRVLLNEEDVAGLRGKKLAIYRGYRIGYLFQNFELLDNMTGRENILLPMAIHGTDETKAVQRANHLASYFEIEDVLEKFPSEMSGGQKQRVAAVRALVMDPEILLADEPTGALDSRSAKILMNKLTGLNKDQRETILMVTHDPNAASYCSRILFIQDGKLFHELRRRVPDESRQAFYERIIAVMAQLGGGSRNVL